MTSKDYFDQVASDWDRMRGSFFSEEVREKALAVAGLEAGGMAADLGAGTGFMTEGLVHEGLSVVAVDQSTGMLAEMRRKMDTAARIHYSVAVAERLPIRHAAMDYAFANMYLHHVEFPPDAISEMVRILRNGGRLVITDLDEHGFEFLRLEQHDRWLGFKRAEIRKWFVAAGLDDVLVDSIGETCCAQSTCGTETASVSIFVASGTKKAETG